MIIIARNKLKFLQAGRTLTIADASGRYRKGRVYAVGVVHNRTICRVRIIAVDPDVIHIRVVPIIEAPRLLARNPIAQRADYVDTPARAMDHEPEAVDGATQERLTELGTLRWQQLFALRQAEVELMELHERVRPAGDRLRWGHADFAAICASSDNDSKRFTSASRRDLIWI